MNPESLLLEGARRVDEWGQIAKKVPSFDIIFEIDHRKLRASGVELEENQRRVLELIEDRKSTRLNSSHTNISYAVFCLKKKTTSRRSRPTCSTHTSKPQ